MNVGEGTSQEVSALIYGRVSLVTSPGYKFRAIRGEARSSIYEGLSIYEVGARPSRS